MSRTTFFLLLAATLFAGDKLFTLPEIYSPGAFTPRGVDNIQWSGDGQYLYYREYDAGQALYRFIKYDITGQSAETLFLSNELFDEANLEPITTKNVLIAPSGDEALITGLSRARRNKASGDFFLYDISAKKLTALRVPENAEQLLPKFSPDEKQLAFVRDNNLFVYDLASAETRQLTTDGSSDILNGHFDWVYEEEFSIIDGWRWSRDGKYIAYWQLDQAAEPQFRISEYDSLYLNWLDMRYPKAGDANAVVRIGIVEVATGNSVFADLGEGDFYVPRIYWHPVRDELMIFRLNRLQNQQEFLLCDVHGKTRPITSDTDPAWIETDDDFFWVNNGTGFIFTSERDGYNHIYHTELQSGATRQITHGDWEVREIAGRDERTGQIIFTAARPTPMESAVFATNVTGTEPVQLSDSPGWHSINMSPAGSAFIDRWSSLQVAPSQILQRPDGKILETLSKSEFPELEDYAMGLPEFIQVPVDDEIKLNGWMLKPAGFSPDKKYPLLMTVYGGPGSQTVRDAWGTVNMWHQFLSQNGFIVVSVDNRGTGARGAAFKKPVYKNLGMLESEDQIAAARYLAEQPYVDGERIAIFGWSYGGYMAAMCLFRGGDTFRAAVSVAPVSDWRFYDTIYTERYMQTPQLNPQGYGTSALAPYVADMKGDLLLMHGTSDDNVHLQNAMVLADNLITANKQFRSMYYPGRFHGIRSRAKNTREHVFTMITGFLLEKLKR